MRFLFITMLIAAAGAACSRRCPPGTQYGRGGKCVGLATDEEAQYGPQLPQPKPPDIGRRAPLAAPELKTLPALAPIVLGGSAPRWFEPIDEVRKQTGISAKPINNVAWQVGPVLSFGATPNLGSVPTQVDYFFLSDGLVGYAVRFFVEEGPSRELYDRVLTQARQAYGSPRTEDQTNIDWLADRLAVHVALTLSEGMTSLRGHTVHLANIHFTVPPSLVQQKSRQARTAN